MDAKARILELEAEVFTLRARLRGASTGSSDGLIPALLGDRSVLEALPDVVAVSTRDHTIVYLNRTIPQRELGMVRGTRSVDYLPEGLRQRYEEAFERAWTTGAPVSVEVQSVSGMWWDTRLIPVKEEGEVAYMLLAAVEVTERKKTEAALLDSQRRLLLAIEATGMGTWTWDLRSDQVVWDRTLCNIFGVPPEDGPRTYEGYLALVHPDDRTHVDTAVRRYIETGVYDELEHKILRPSGEVRHALAKASTIFDESGRVIGFLGGLFDLTEKKRFEDQLRQVQKMEAVGQLTAGIAHNFNNLLSVILPNVTLCKADADEETFARLSDVEHAATRAADLVRDLMLFSRADASGRKTTIDVVGSVRRTVEICRTTFDRHIAIELAAAPALPLAIANSGQIEQVLLNLCLNARDAFEEADTPKPRIAIRVDTSPAGHARVRVTDNGPGMDEATRSRVFEPFFTTKEVGRGTGLGLASAYAIVRDHHGQIVCESRPGSGTTFEITLPPATDAVAPVTTGAVAPSSGGTETVLVIDDEPMVRRVVRALLEQKGYTVLEAVDGLEGVQVYESARDRIALVILDHSMPGLSGDQVLRRFAELDARVPVVLLSGHPAGAHRERGVSAVLGKPTDGRTLLHVVRRVLDEAAPTGG